MPESKAHEHLLNKKVSVSGTFPIPDGQGGIAFASVEGTLVAVDDLTLSLRADGQTEAAVFERCNVRCTALVPSTIAVPPRGLVIPKRGGN